MKKYKLPKIILFSVLLLSILQFLWFYQPGLFINPSFLIRESSGIVPFQKISYGSHCAMCDTYREFNFTIWNNGLVEFEGIKDVHVIGKKTRYLSSRNMDKLIESFELSNFFSVVRQTDMTCLDGQYVSIAVSTLSKQREFGSYCTAAIPKSVVDFEKTVFEVSGVDDWVDKP